MGILAWIVLGLISGALAKLIMPGNQSNNWLTTLLLGIVGALLGGYVSSLLGWGGLDGFSLRSLLLGVGGSLLLLALFGAARRGSYRTRTPRRYRTR